MNEIDKLMEEIINGVEDEPTEDNPIEDTHVEVSVTVPIIEEKKTEATKPNEEVMRVSSELKQNWTFMYSRFLSEDGLPDDFSHLGIFLISFLGDKDLAERFYDELDILEADKNNPYTKKMIIDAIYVRPKAYYECNLIGRQIRNLDKRFNLDTKDAKDGDKKVYTALRNALRTILKEVNKDLPVINDCLLVATTIAVKFTELQYRMAPREMIFGNTPYGDSYVRKPKNNVIHGDNL